MLQSREKEVESCADGPLLDWARSAARGEMRSGVKVGQSLRISYRFLTDKTGRKTGDSPVELGLNVLDIRKPFFGVLCASCP